MGGSRMREPERRMAANAKPKRICEMAIEKRMETAEPHVRK